MSILDVWRSADARDFEVSVGRTKGEGKLVMWRLRWPEFVREVVHCMRAGDSILEERKGRICRANSRQVRYVVVSIV